MTEAQDITPTLGADFLVCGIEGQRCAVLNVLRERKVSAVTEGLVLLGQQTIKVPSVLHDTGATDHNYISPDLFVKLKTFVSQSDIRSIKGAVLLGDASTTKPIDTEIRLLVRFWDPGGMAHQGTAWFQVFKTGHDMIIGFPTIVDTFLDLMVALLRDGAERRAEQRDAGEILFDALSHIIDLGDGNIPRSADLIPAWSHPLQEAEEEAELYIPVNFEAALYFLSVSPEEAVSDFIALLDTHVSKEFKEAENIIELLSKTHIKQFIPDNWEGIRGIPLLELDWIEETVGSLRSVLQSRPVNPRLFADAAKEFQRLRTYHYRESKSPVASPLVIAPKATAPYIRFCGDYSVKINKHIRVPHGYIPRVEHEIERIKRYKVFADLDLTTAFHQVKLGPVTSARLSVVTPWGQFEPVFMPEGVAPASIVLQDVMRKLFEDFSEWTIVMFDNILIMADDFRDLYDKCKIFLKRCEERNVILKMAKSFIGFREVKFFGYHITSDHFELGEDRKDVIRRLPFPNTVKATQSFLGVGIFFQKFVPHYATKVAPMYDMTKQNFIWDEKTWKYDYRGAFEDAKKAILDALKLYFPDYNLRWIMRTDASNFGVGGVLLQVFIDKDGNNILQPIGFVSKKFSEQASQWATIQQECFGIYFTVNKFAYYVRGKFFELETDHANLQWMENSDTPMIVRMRVYIQGFVHYMRHIPKAHNILADWWSRTQLSEVSTLNFLLWLCCANEVSAFSFILSHHGIEGSAGETLSILQEATIWSVENIENEVTDQNEAISKIREAFKAVHNGRLGHHGARRTWLALNESFPGHSISFEVVRDLVMSCPVCQKDRLRMANSIKPMYRSIKQENFRKAIGIDHVTITPADEDGNNVLTVVVNLFNGLARMYPYKTISAENTAISIFKYQCAHGLFDEIHTDPGIDFKAKLTSELEKYLGVTHVFSLVDRHQSNGVERVIQEILRHIRALVYEERLIAKWSQFPVLSIIEYIVNTTPLSERGGYTAYQLTFGTADQLYYVFKEAVQNSSSLKWPDLVAQLDENIRTVRDASRKYQQALINERTLKAGEIHNSFQKGDFITLKTEGMRKSKLTPKFRGPYEVIQQIKNDVECRHLSTGAVDFLDVEKVQLFDSSREDAIEAANWDADSYRVAGIKAWRGDVWHRTTMEFLVVYADGDELWMRFNTDSNNISKTSIFEDYCRSKPELYVLVYTIVQAQKIRRDRNKERITTLKPGDVFYLDLRSYGWLWYRNLGLIDADTKTYVTECYVLEFASKETKVFIEDRTLNIEFWYRNFDVTCHAYRRDLSRGEVLVDSKLLVDFPQILKR